VNILVSVVIPAYNEEKYIASAIDSIIKQTYKSWEIIVVNDASTDNTINIIEKYKDDRIHIINNQQNMGAGEAQNIGFMNAKGTYIAILAGDDVACPDRLQRQVQYLTDNPEIGLLGTGYKIIDQDSVTVRKVQYELSPIEVRWKLLYGNPIGASTVMFKTKILAECGMYDCNIVYGEDMELWARIAQKYDIAVIPDILTQYRVHSGSLTSKIEKTDKTMSISNIIRRNIQTIIDITIDEEICLMLSTSVKSGNIKRKNVISDAIGMVIVCRDIYGEKYSINTEQREIINKNLQYNIARIIMSYGMDKNVMKVCIKAYDRTVEKIACVATAIKAAYEHYRHRIGIIINN